MPCLLANAARLRDGRLYARSGSSFVSWRRSVLRKAVVILADPLAGLFSLGRAQKLKTHFPSIYLSPAQTFHFAALAPLIIPSALTSKTMKVLCLLLALGVLAASVSCESEFCQEERTKCETRCNGYKVHFDCKDEGGARAVSCSCGERREREAGSSHGSGSSSAKTQADGGSFAMVSSALDI